MTDAGHQGVEVAPGLRVAVNRAMRAAFSERRGVGPGSASLGGHEAVTGSTAADTMQAEVTVVEPVRLAVAGATGSDDVQAEVSVDGEVGVRDHGASSSDSAESLWDDAFAAWAADRGRPFWQHLRVRAEAAGWAASDESPYPLYVLRSRERDGRVFVVPDPDAQVGNAHLRAAYEIEGQPPSLRDAGIRSVLKAAVANAVPDRYVVHSLVTKGRLRVE